MLSAATINDCFKVLRESGSFDQTRDLAETVLRDVIGVPAPQPAPALMAWDLAAPGSSDFTALFFFGDPLFPF